MFIILYHMTCYVFNSFGEIYVDTEIYLIKN